MKKILFILMTVLLIAVLVLLYAFRDELTQSTESRPAARTIIPVVPGKTTEQTAAVSETAIYDESQIQPLIKLEADETFLQALNIDLDKDGLQDQICAVRKLPEPYIYLVPAIQRSSASEYVRLEPIKTGITQSRTLLFYILDVIGNRSNALVFSGMTAENHQLLAIYLPSIGQDGTVSFTPVADLRADGPINIREIQRSDAYELGLTTGESYPVVSYNSDPEAQQTLDQIERIYRWDNNLKRYILSSESKIPGKKIESNLIRQLQGGDITSFMQFLSGLWYISNSSGNTTRYLFINPDEKEIIFHNTNTEEVYSIESGVPRRYGAYLTSRNRSISSIRRMIDIEVTSIDEIKIKIQEDVKLKIGVASDWDGQYRKMSTRPAETGTPYNTETLPLNKVLVSKTQWTAEDKTQLTIENFRYTLQREDRTETGICAVLKVRDTQVLQFKPEQTGSRSTFFQAELKDNILLLTEVQVSIHGLNVTGSAGQVFTRSNTQ